MRLDPDSSSSKGPHSHTNGSSSQGHKNGASPPTNGHSSDTNGTVSPTRRGVSKTSSKYQPTFFGHDREEVTRLLIQGLDDLGYRSAANRLSQESGYEVESPTVAAFRNAIIQGQWSEAESLLFGVDSEADGGGVSISNGDWQHLRGLRLAEGAHPNAMRFSIREQKYLELLENQDTGKAMMVLRHELQPLHYDRRHLDTLASHLVCTSVENLREDARWDGAHGQSRRKLLQLLSRSISPSVMIPEHRLAVLLDQLKQSQISKCLYHNPSTAPSLFTDHICDRSQFPLETVFELNANKGEIWCLEFSHNGKYLAAAGSDKAVVIYETTTFQVSQQYQEHEAGVVHLSWSPDDGLLVSCSQDHTAKVWNMQTREPIVHINHHNHCVTAAAWAPDGKSFVTGSHDKQSQLCSWTAAGQPIFCWEDINHRIQGCVISPDGQRMVTISSENEITVYNYVTRMFDYQMKVASKMTCISISDDSRYVLVNMADNEIQLFDLETADIVRRFMGQKQGEFVLRSSFGGADQNLIISGSEDSKVYIWHKENGTLIETLEGHSRGCVNAVSWNPADPCMFASGGDDMRVRM
ncbi:hypothetical protein ACLMJK_001127 [Lecanora helva]